LKSSRAGDTRFDASQYAFFGNNVLEEVELGGLEDDNDSDAAFIGVNDTERPLSSQGNALEVQPFIYSMLDKCCIEYNS
jgi:DNA topoisomerase 2-associated protein PAT1